MLLVILKLVVVCGVIVDFYDACSVVIMTDEQSRDQAPWLGCEDDWRISRERAESVRPGVFIYQPGLQCFVAVVGCTVLRNPDLMFIDLEDGKTVCVPFGESLYIRCAVV